MSLARRDMRAVCLFGTRILGATALLVGFVLTTTASAAESQALDCKGIVEQAKAGTLDAALRTTIAVTCPEESIKQLQQFGVITPKLATALIDKRAATATQALVCSEIVRLSKSGGLTAAALANARVDCSAEDISRLEQFGVISPTIATALRSRSSGGAVAQPSASSPPFDYSLGPSVLHGSKQTPLPANRLAVVAVATKTESAREALKDAAVMSGIQTGMERAILDTGLGSSSTGTRGVIDAGLAAMKIWGNRGKPGFQFKLLSSPTATTQVPAGPVTLVVPQHYTKLRLCRLAEYEQGFRLLASAKGRVKPDNTFLPSDDKERSKEQVEEIAVTMIHRDELGVAYRTPVLQPGEHYALTDGTKVAYDFSVR